MPADVPADVPVDVTVDVTVTVDDGWVLLLTGGEILV